MLCRYETTLHAICPIHKVRDTYQVTIESPHCVMVEDLLAFVAKASGVEETQEDITASFARAFPGCAITSTGYHSGVRTTVIAP